MSASDKIRKRYDRNAGLYDLIEAMMEKGRMILSIRLLHPAYFALFLILLRGLWRLNEYAKVMERYS